jgi:hypothetical protein
VPFIWWCSTPTSFWMCSFDCLPIHPASLLSVYLLSTHHVPSASGWALLPLPSPMTDGPFPITYLHIFLCLLRDDNAIMLSSSKLTTNSLLRFQDIFLFYL